MPRIFVAGSKSQAEIVLGKREAHYLKDVLRLKEGDRVTIFDEEEGEGYIKDFLPGKVVVIVEKWKRVERELSFSLTLGQAVLKGEKMDLVMEKATEIGVGSIIPLVTERVIPRDRGLEKQKRWERISGEAARQSRRLTPPEVSAPITLSDFLKKRLTGLKVVPWEEEKGPGLFKLLKERPRPEEVAVVIGPEGGFAEGEIEQLRGAGFETVSLGPFILRSETAVIYTLSCLAGFYHG